MAYCCTRPAAAHGLLLHKACSCTRLTVAQGSQVHTAYSCTRLAGAHGSQLHTADSCTRPAAAHGLLLHKNRSCTRLTVAQGPQLHMDYSCSRLAGAHGPQLHTARSCTRLTVTHSSLLHTTHVLLTVNMSFWKQEDQLYSDEHSSSSSSIICQTTGPKPLPKRFLHTVRSRASSFNWQYPLLSLRSSSSFLRLLTRLLVTSICPFVFPWITCCRRQFLRKMWPIQLAFRFLISCRYVYIYIYHHHHHYQ